MTTSSSNYHVEMNPSDVGNNDRYVVQEIIKVLDSHLQSANLVCCREDVYQDHSIIHLRDHHLVNLTHYLLQASSLTGSLKIEY